MFQIGGFRFFMNFYHLDDVTAGSRKVGFTFCLPPPYRIRQIVFADRGFYIAGFAEWNNLPLTVRSANFVGIFHSRLKTHLYRLAFNEP